MSDFNERLQQGDAKVCQDIKQTYGRAVMGWLRDKYRTLDADQAREALDRAVVNLWDSREQFSAERTSVSKRLNYFAELAAWALLLKSDFGTVAQHLEKTVYSYILWMLRRFRYEGDLVETAEDIRQQTFLSAWRSLDRFDPKRSVKAWFWKIARNCLLTELQRRGRKPASVTVEQLDAQAGTREDDEVSTVLKDFCNILEQIPTHHQELLYMSIENDRRYGPEAVQNLAYSSPTSVRVTRNRLVKKIRGEMRKRGHFAGEALPGAGREAADTGPPPDHMV